MRFQKKKDLGFNNASYSLSTASPVKAFIHHSSQSVISAPTTTPYTLTLLEKSDLDHPQILSIISCSTLQWTPVSGSVSRLVFLSPSFVGKTTNQAWSGGSQDGTPVASVVGKLTAEKPTLTS